MQQYDSKSDLTGFISWILLYTNFKDALGLAHCYHAMSFRICISFSNTGVKSLWIIVYFQNVLFNRTWLFNELVFFSIAYKKCLNKNIFCTFHIRYSLRVLWFHHNKQHFIKHITTNDIPNRKCTKYRSQK